MSSPPRRITRGSLARFAYNVGASGSNSNPPALPDIEDIASPARKRKRTTTTTAIPSALTSPVSRRRKIKEEPASERKIRPELLSPRAPPTPTTRTTRSGRQLPPTSIKPEPKEEDAEEDEKPDIANTPSSRRRARKPARKIKTEDNGASVKIEPPSDWEQMYNLVKEMRLSPDGPAYNAAVDTMGCERLAEPNATPRDSRFQTLISLMLSSQTKDTVTSLVIKKLQTQLPAASPGGKVGLNVENINAVEPGRLNEMIGTVGFHNNKTKYIKQTGVLLKDKFGGDIPDTVEGLMSLPGVGPKMAHLCMSAAWNDTQGIGVDVHVHRLTNMWGWNKTKTPEETRMALESWLPRDKWREINYLLVGFGQTVCQSTSRKCGECKLFDKGLCKRVTLQDRIRINQERIDKMNEGRDYRAEYFKRRRELKGYDEFEDYEAEDDHWHGAELDQEALFDGPYPDLVEEGMYLKQSVKEEDEVETGDNIQAPLKKEEEGTPAAIIKQELGHLEDNEYDRPPPLAFIKREEAPRQPSPLVKQEVVKKEEPGGNALDQLPAPANPPRVKQEKQEANDDEGDNVSPYVNGGHAATVKQEAEGVKQEEEELQTPKIEHGVKREPITEDEGGKSGSMTVRVKQEVKVES